MSNKDKSSINLNDESVIIVSPEEVPTTSVPTTSVPTTTMSKDHRGSDIEKLTGEENYFPWSLQMEAWLTDLDLWVNIDKAVLTPSEIEIGKKSYRRIILKMSLQILSSVASMLTDTNGIELLKILRNKFFRGTAITKMNLVREAFESKSPNANLKDLKQHIDELRNKFHRLTMMKGTVPEFVKVACLLCSTPSFLSGSISAYHSKDESDLTFENAANTIISELERRNLEGAQNVEENFSHASTTAPNNNRAWRLANLNCSSCKRRGHLAERCWNNNKKAESNKPNKYKNQKYSPKSSHVAEAEEEPARYGMFSNAFAATLSTLEKSFIEAPITNPHWREEISIFNRLEPREKLNLVLPQQQSKRRIVIPSDNPKDDKKARKIQKVSESKSKISTNEIRNASHKFNKEKVSEEISFFMDPSEIEFMNKELNRYETSFTISNHEHSENWLIDSGASIHMAHNKSLFQQINMNTKGHIKIADGNSIPILGHGKIVIIIENNGQPMNLLLENVAYAPDLHINLISVPALINTHGPILFTKESCSLKVKNKFIKIASPIGRNFILNSIPYTSASPCIHEWHKRLAHKNLREVKRLKTFGLQFQNCSCSDQCDACLKGKSTETSFPKHSEKPEHPLDIIVSDLCGPYRTQSFEGFKYILTLTDVCTDYVQVKFLRNKDEATQHIISYIEFLKTQLNKKPKIFRSDGGGEFNNLKLKNFFEKEGIKFETSCPYSPQQNGISERKNRTLNDAVRTLLISAELPERFWAEAMRNVVYTFNHINRKEQAKSPIELFTGKESKAIFGEFGHTVYVPTIKHNRGKLDPHAATMKFLSVDNISKGFRIWDGNKVIIRRSIYPLKNKKINYKFPSYDIIEEESSDCENEKVNEPRRSKRIKEKLLKSSENLACVSDERDPSTFKEAISSADSCQWMMAMLEELQSLETTKTYELTNLPKDRKAIGCKWVFKKKNENGVIRYKARLVAKGFSQKYGQDYDEVFAPVVNSTTIRLLLSVAGKLNLKVKQFDVKTAFLNGKLEEQIFMKQPEGFINGDKVCWLKKALYGLKQAARSWNITLTKTLKLSGFTQSEEDECLFTSGSNSDRIYIIVHVDDFLCAAPTYEMIDETFKKLSKHFEMKDVGEVKQFLGVNIYRSDEGYFSINQSDYIEKIAKEFSLETTKPQKYPIDPGYYKLECDEYLNSNSEYRTIIGKLLYISTNSRPDISASVCILAQRIENPRKIDLSEAHRVIKYLYHTKHYQLSLNRPNTCQELIAFSDADFGENKVDAKSHSGMVCFINGGLISWACRKQTYVAQSTCEAEFYAANETIRQIIWIQKLIKVFNINLDTPTTILIDNQGAINKLENNEFKCRTKYISVKFHFIRDWLKRKLIKFTYCPSEKNIADMLTKPLSGIKITNLRRASGIIDLTNINEKSSLIF